MYQIEMSLVFIRILRSYKNIVDVHPQDDPQVVSKGIVHNALAKEHKNPLEGAKLCVESGFLDIFVVDLDLVKPTNKVDLQKYGGTPQCTQDGWD